MKCSLNLFLENDNVNELFGFSKKPQIEPYEMKILKNIADKFPKKMKVTNKEFANKALGTSEFNLNAKIETKVNDEFIQIFVNTEIPSKSIKEINSEFRLFKTDRASELKLKGIVNDRKMVDNGKIIENLEPKTVVKNVLELINKAIALEITRISRITESVRRKLIVNRKF